MGAEGAPLRGPQTVPAPTCVPPGSPSLGGEHTPPPRLQKSADVLGAKPRQLVPVVLCLFVLDPTHDRLFLQRSCDPRTTHARKVSKFPLSRRLWGELSWREPDARRSRLSCTSGRGPTERIGMGRSRCWRHRVGPLVVAGVSRSAFDNHQYLCPDCAAPVDLELFANRSWPYVHPDTGGAACVWHRSTPD
jgi:hypothetical protein